MILAEVTIKNRMALLAQITGCMVSTKNNYLDGNMMAINVTNKKTQFNTVF